MKKLVIILIFCGFTFLGNAQNESVEKSIFGIQTGLLGIWVHNEAKLSNKFVLRSEIGFDLGLYQSFFSDDTDFLFAPVITLEPKFYYNLDKRASKNKETSGNSGNFLSLKTSFHPDWFTISSDDGVYVSNQIAIIPTWGIRRNIGEHFNYETGIGVGYARVFDDGIYEGYGETAVNVHARIGYRF